MSMNFRKSAISKIQEIIFRVGTILHGRSGNRKQTYFFLGLSTNEILSVKSFGLALFDITDALQILKEIYRNGTQITKQ